MRIITFWEFILEIFKILHHYYLIFCFHFAITKLRIGTWLR